MRLRPRWILPWRRPAGWGERKLRTRMITAATLAVSVGIGACVVFGYVAVRTELLANMDQQLARQATSLAPMARFLAKPSKETVAPTGKLESGEALLQRYWATNGHHFGDAVGISQVVTSAGHTVSAQSPSAAVPGKPPPSRSSRRTNWSRPDCPMTDTGPYSSTATPCASTRCM